MKLVFYVKKSFQTKNKWNKFRLMGLLDGFFTQQRKLKESTGCNKSLIKQSPCSTRLHISVRYYKQKQVSFLWKIKHSAIVIVFR